MSIKYAILNPITGQYDYVNSIDEVKASLAKNAWDLYLMHTQNRPYSVVNYAEDGSSTWSTPQGDPITTFEEVYGLIESTSTNYVDNI